MCGASPGSKMRMYGEVPHPPLRSTAICLQKLCTGAEVTPKWSIRICPYFYYCVKLSKDDHEQEMDRPPMRLGVMDRPRSDDQPNL